MCFIFKLLKANLVCLGDLRRRKMKNRQETEELEEEKGRVEMKTEKI